MKDKKAFTLIELIAVLVILAILALIVTPLVLNIVRKAKDSANKRSVDAYGKAVELAIATYLLDTGDFPTSINDLQVEYSGKEVVCKIQQLNEDSSVYLSECKVGNSEVKDSGTDDGWYHYGKNESKYDYKIGDQVTYNGIDFYVIANSEKGSDSVTMLKAEPIKTSEVDLSGTEIFAKVSESTNVFNDGYIHSAYLYSDTCTSLAVGDGTATGCTTDYKLSSIKQVVDAWVADKFNSNDLNEDTTGYSTRLITLDELQNNLVFVKESNDTSYWYVNSDNTPEWVYNSNYWYWTMSSYNDSDSSLWYESNGSLHPISVNSGYESMVRPVVTLLKSAIK